MAKLDKCQKPKTWSPHPVYDQYGPIEPREQALERLGLDPQYRYVLFFGLVRPYKGLDLLIEAAANKRLQNYNVKVLVAGEFYEPKEQYIDEIAGLGMEDRVVIHDHFIPDEQVKDYFNAADLVAQPYRSATQSPEMHSIANALVDFYENDRFEEFRMNLLKEKEKFSWPKLVEAILSLIELR